MLVDFLPLIAIVRQQDFQVCGTFRGTVDAVVNNDSGQGLYLAQIDLPPGLRVAVGVEPESAIDHAVASTGRILFGSDRVAGRRQLSHDGLAGPVGLDLHGSTDLFCLNRREPEERGK